MGNNAIIIILSSLALLGSACGPKKQKDRHFIGEPRKEEPETPLTTSDPKDDDIGQTMVVTFDDTLLGTWINDCVNTQDEGDGSFTSEHMKLVVSNPESKPEIDAAIESFKDKDCKKGNEWMTRRAISLISISESTLGNGIKNIDSVAEKLALMPQTDDEAKALNRKIKCGYKSWKKGEEVDVTLLPCGDARTVNKGDKGYDIYKVGSSALQFGIDMTNIPEGSDIGRKPETRPSTLNKAAVFSKASN
jgi:hypothetical protein